MCFSIEWIEHLFVLLIIIGAVVALVRLLLPLVLGWMGSPGGIILQAINIVMWAFIAIFCVYIIFELISCLLSGGGGFGLAFPRGR